MGTTFDRVAFAAFLPCSMQSNTVTIDFMFGSTVFAIPMSRLVATYNATTCYFNIIPSNASGLDEITMGTVFTDSAYIVYDFSHNQVSLAPIDTQSSTSNITVHSSARTVFARLLAPVPARLMPAAPRRQPICRQQPTASLLEPKSVSKVVRVVGAYFYSL
jgi:hypothetical protein